jgi:uncharacterized protein YgiM (DUF1202 family)
MMRGSAGFGQERTIWLIVGVVVVALIGIGLLWLGFTLGRGGRGTEVAQATTTATSLAPLPTSLAVVSTNTPLPTDTLPPAPTATETPIPEPMIVAQEGGVNLRSGPGTNFSTVGRLEGGASARVTGRYGEWWQIDYGGVSAWVADWVVSASNTDGVPEAVPPPSPIPATRIPPTATPIPATATPAVTPTPDTRGIKANTFVVGNKSGESVKPNTTFGNAGDIWFKFEVVNTTGGGIRYTKLGCWVQENEHFQVSWGAAGAETLNAGQTLAWLDHLYNDKANMGKGTYHLWLRICFEDGYCVNLAGPAEAKIQ